MKIYFTLNQLPGVIIDNTRPGFEIAGPGLYADLEIASTQLLDNILWKGKVMDLITSHKAFVNSNLATMLYESRCRRARRRRTSSRRTMPSRSAGGPADRPGLHHAHGPRDRRRRRAARHRREGDLPLPRDAAPADGPQPAGRPDPDAALHAGHDDGAAAGADPPRHGALQHVPPDVRSVRPRPRLVRRRRPLPDGGHSTSRSTGRPSCPTTSAAARCTAPSSSPTSCRRARCS